MGFLSFFLWFLKMFKLVLRVQIKKKTSRDISRYRRKQKKKKTVNFEKKKKSH